MFLLGYLLFRSSALFLFNFIQNSLELLQARAYVLKLIMAYRISICHAVLRVLVFSISFLLTLAGSALVGMTAHQMVLEKVTNDPNYWVTIAIGSLMIFVGFLGCWGAAKENNCCLGTYAICIGIVLILTIVGGVLLSRQVQLTQMQLISLIVVGVIQGLAVVSSISLCLVIRQQESAANNYYYQ